MKSKQGISDEDIEEMIEGMLWLWTELLSLKGLTTVGGTECRTFEIFLFSDPYLVWNI